jgi:hypothetical protein
MQTLEDGQSRLRGVRVQSASVASDGTLKPGKGKTEIAFPGCKDWQPRKCPKGSVATGLRAGYSDGSQGYAGLELRCHAIASSAAADAGQ